MIDSANAALALQSSNDGSFPPGTNGPHNQMTTPKVRNTAHWICVLLYCYKLKKINDYKFQQRRLYHLMSQEARLMGIHFSIAITKMGTSV